MKDYLVFVHFPYLQLVETLGRVKARDKSEAWGIAKACMEKEERAPYNIIPTVYCGHPLIMVTKPGKMYLKLN